MSEQEVDLRSYWSAVAARWWLPVAGLLAGAAIGYALSLGGSDVWRGEALVYLGQPVTPAGAQVQSLSTNPAAAREIAASGAAQRRAERTAELPRGELAGKVSVAAVSGNLSRLGQNPLVRVRVEGGTRRVAQAANALSRTVVARVSEYPAEKIRTLKAAIETLEADLAEARGRPAETEVLLWRAELNEQLLAARLNLNQAEQVESARVVEDAVARKVTAQSRRNQIVVGALLGLLLGLAAALAWESALALRRR